MKKLFALFSVSVLLFSCGKDDLEEIEIYKPCSETIYLVIENEYYQVCNYETLLEIPSGTKLKLAYKEIDECKGESIPVCGTVNPVPLSKSWVKIKYQI